MVNEFSAPDQLNVVRAPMNREGDSFTPLKNRKISQKNKIIYLSIAMLACALLLIPGVFMVQRVTRLLSQAWEKVNYQEIRSQFPVGVDLSNPEYATISAIIEGRRCAQFDEPRLPAGNVFLFDNETGTIFTYPLEENTIEFNVTLLPGTYYLFFQPQSELQPFFAATGSDHNLMAVELNAQQISDTIEICDPDYLSHWLPPELQPGAKTETLSSQRKIADKNQLPEVTDVEITPANVHGLICNYGPDVYPAGSVMFYDVEQNTLVAYQVNENDNVFSAQIPPGNYAIFFSPQNPLLPIYGFTEYVSCGLNPASCQNHDVHINKIMPGEEYGNIQICDPQYVQEGLPEELRYENR